MQTVPIPPLKVTNPVGKACVVTSHIVRLTIIVRSIRVLVTGQWEKFVQSMVILVTTIISSSERDVKVNTRERIFVRFVTTMNERQNLPTENELHFI
ncbi:hypothetical protein PoB_006109800 [Plakobranchus ocellatus]|uniref:Uncharacterized protein n=1 Tax=Plakobranchus ocellatus TaxID=259542 RepID=A0AAV4CRW8_9GAST|nr:hypothetical protein PoB_006109800 [Plakobranchus ocellatus]